MNETLRSGEVAAEADVNIETLRYYERRGLLEEPPRLASRQRLYTQDAVRRVRAIKLAQSLGFTLDEIQSLLELREHPDRQSVDGGVVRAAREKLRQVEEKEIALQDIKTHLQAIIEKGCHAIVGCTCGDCPLDDGWGPGLSSREGPEYQKDAETQGLVPPSRLRRVKRVLPAGAMAVIGCSACLLPGLVAGGLGVGFLASLAEWFESGVLLLVALLAWVMMVALVAYSRQASRSTCACHASR